MRQNLLLDQQYVEIVFREIFRQCEVRIQCFSCPTYYLSSTQDKIRLTAFHITYN